MEVIITPKAVKQFQKLPKQDSVKLKKKMLTICENPLEGKKLTGEFTELRSLRIWPYRIIYYIDQRKSKIFIVTIAHRQGVYK